MSLLTVCLEVAFEV